MRRVTTVMALFFLAAVLVQCGDGGSANPGISPLEPGLPLASTGEIQATATGFTAALPELMVAENCAAEEQYCGGTISNPNVDTIVAYAVSGPDYVDMFCSGSIGTFRVHSDPYSRNCLDCDNECYEPGRYDACAADPQRGSDSTYACAYVPNSGGGDCVGYKCPAGYVVSDNHSDYYTGYQTPECVPVDPPPAEPLELDPISGPSDIAPDETGCTWTANVSGGTEPYSYNWFSDGTYVGSGSSWTGGVLDGDMDTSFMLTVNVSDAAGEGASESLFVQESASGTTCSGFPKKF